MLNGLAQINLELTSRCDKQTLCSFCGHQDPQVHPGLRFGTMRWELLEELAAAVPPGIVVQFHRDGDPLAFPHVGKALDLFASNIRSIVTHGERLAQKATEVIGHCETVTVSIFRGDPDAALQLASLRAFLEKKGAAALPRVLLKVVGDLDDGEMQPYLALGVPVLRRLLHVARSNARYARSLPAMPEHGVCLDLLHHPSVAWDGRVYLCNRLDTHDRGLIGHLAESSLDEIWNGAVRKQYIQQHLMGNRGAVPPCADCQYYGIATS